MFQEDESISHLFFGCKVSISVWYLVSAWLGVYAVLHVDDPLRNFLQFGRNIIEKKNRKLRYLIWFTNGYYGARNNVVFKGLTADCIVMFNRVMCAYLKKSCNVYFMFVVY